MAGGRFADAVPCMVCMGDDNKLVKAERVYEGVEDDHYRCVRGHDFGLDWRGKPPTEPQWPPPAELVAALGQPIETGAAATRPATYYAVNDRPVMLAPTPDGGEAVLVFDFVTGELVPDPRYYAYLVPGSGQDVDRLTAEEFEQRVAALRKELAPGRALAGKIRGWAERLCRVRSMSKRDLAAALEGAAESRPGGVTQIDLDDREVGLGGVNVRFAPGLVRRADVVAAFGAGNPLPRLAPNHPTRVMHELRLADAPHRCSVFVEYGLDPIDDGVRGIKLRVDPGSSGATS